MPITSQEFEQLLHIAGPVATVLAMALFIAAQVIAKRDQSSPERFEARLRKCERMEPRVRCLEEKVEQMEFDEDRFERDYDRDQEKMRNLIRRGNPAKNDKVEG